MGQVVQVVHGQGQCVGDLLAVGFDLGGAGTQVQVEEVGLGGGEGQEGPEGGTESEMLRPWCGRLSSERSGGASPLRVERQVSPEGAGAYPHLCRASVV